MNREMSPTRKSLKKQIMGPMENRKTPIGRNRVINDGSSFRQRKAQNTEAAEERFW